MKQLAQYSLVQVVAIHYPIDSYDGWHVNQRPPTIGDYGILIDILEARGLQNKYVVESSDEEGLTIWLADFEAEELKAVDWEEYRQQRMLSNTPDPEK